MREGVLEVREGGQSEGEGERGKEEKKGGSIRTHHVT